MAEFPELGKQCSIGLCSRLDFTPHFCKHCERYFCGEHRLAHQCSSSASAQWDGNEKLKNAPPLKYFMCSRDGCLESELVKIVCERCLLNYCLKHRHPGEHTCITEPNPKEIIAEKMKEIREKLGVVETLPSTSTTKELPTRKVYSDPERKKMEKIGLMKYKASCKGVSIPSNDQRFLFVTADEIAPKDGEFILIGANWSVSRCVDTAISRLGFQNTNSDVWGKKRRLYPLEESDPLPFEAESGQKIVFNENKVAYLELRLDS